MPVRGSVPVNRTDFGILNRAILPSRNPSRSASEACAPGRSTTTARPTSPHRASGTPITPQSATAGCSRSTFSTSAG